MTDPRLIRHPDRFGWGYTSITRAGDPAADVGFSFGILRLRAGERHAVPAGEEGALLLLDGELELVFDDQHAIAKRGSIFDEDPVALHFSADARVALEARTDCELAALQVENDRSFEPRLFDRASMAEPSEHRGKGRLDDTAYRIVRTIFDGRNRPEAALVLGEVVNFPGRWSSYPPHHHPQPEVYHYRFTEPQGYGHAELGETVLRVRQGDTVKITDTNDHSQVAAPGYGMYYLWAIRHLPGNPYTVPEFTEEHLWLNQPDAPIWRPRRDR